MESKRGNIFVIGLVILLLISISVGGYLFWQKQQLQQTPQPTPTTNPTTKDDETTNWKTYTSTQGYTLKYPPDWPAPIEKVNKSEIASEAITDFGEKLEIISGFYQRSGFPKPATLDEYVNIFLYQAGINSKQIQDFSFQGIKGKIFISTKTTILVPFPENNPKILSLVYPTNTASSHINQTLSTFKFLPVNQTDTTSPQKITITMSAQNSTGENGAVTLTDLGNSQTRVSIKVDNAPGGGQPANIYLGSCSNLNTVKYSLTDVTNGLKTNLAPGESDTVLNISLQNLRSMLPLAIGVRYASSFTNPFLSSCGDLK